MKLTRERQTSKTMYGHVEFAINQASVIALKKALGKNYDDAKKVFKKGVCSGVLKL